MTVEQVQGWSRIVPWVLSLLAWTLGFAALSVAWGPDATWDFLNYHLYNPYALLHGRSELDIAPAQLQTFFLPLIDLPAHVLRSGLNDWPNVLGAILSLPHALGAFLVTAITLHFVPGRGVVRWLLAMLAAGFGATAAGALAVIATGQSEMIPGCLVLAGVLILLRQLDPERLDVERPGPVRRRVDARGALVAGGMAFGVACGLKLTAVVFVAGAAAAILVAWRGRIQHRLLALCLFGACVALCMVILDAWWWWQLWRRWGNPLFPLFNGVFKSPYAEPLNLGTSPYRPQTLLEALFYPAYWAFAVTHRAIELPMRDPRLLVGEIGFGVAALLQIAGSALGRVDGRRRQIMFLLVFVGVSYAAWEAQFSILRYLAPIEFLSGTVVVLALRPFARGWFGRVAAATVATAVLVWAAAATVYPDWARASPRERAVDVVVPAIAPDSLVLLLDDGPASYIAAFVPSSVRVAGVNSNFIRPTVRTRLQEGLDELVRHHTGPIYGVENIRELPGHADPVLHYYGLHRVGNECALVRSNLDRNSLQMCRLERERVP